MAIQPAPAHFEGTLSDLYDRHIEGALPSRNAVSRFHQWMCRYVDADSKDAPERVFPVRAVTGTTRRQNLKTADGTCIAPCDNSPGWVVHALLTSDTGSHRVQLEDWADFERLMARDIATHMFDVKKCLAWSANTFGWYVAHILPAKNGDTDWRRWSRREVAGRFFRTLHPCNLFLVPGVRNRELGESTEVIAWMASRFAERYGPDLWQDFVHRSTGALPAAASQAKATGSIWVRIQQPEPRSKNSVETPPPDHDVDSRARVQQRYAAARLTFKRDVIEPLSEDDAFEVVTPFGTFRFTKREFYSDFANIPLTRSYREHGVYHGASLHLKALHRRMPA